jgi:hypothetical protein
MLLAALEPDKPKDEAFLLLNLIPLAFPLGGSAAP